MCCVQCRRYQAIRVNMFTVHINECIQLNIQLNAFNVYSGELVSQIFGLIKLQEAVFGSEITKHYIKKQIICKQEIGSGF